MKRKGVADLPLHYGKAPSWLIRRMAQLAKGITTVLIDEYGRDTFLRRLSDPYWFQALGCVLGYDWHSSGVTTVVTGVLKSVLTPQEFGVAVCGGKGKASVRAPHEILEVGDLFGLSTCTIDSLRYASRMSAKIDNAAIQAGYPLYHHTFFITEDGKWAVIQQGMSVSDRTARRYHWLSETVESVVVEPHSAIVGDAKRERVLDMTARESEDCRAVSVGLVTETPKLIAKMVKSARTIYQKSLDAWLLQDPGDVRKADATSFLSMPVRLNWRTLSKAYEFQPKDYEGLLSIKGIGPSTVRGLALLSELVYGAKPSWSDPVKYSFAYGGKDGVPFPVDREAMDESIQVLEGAVKNARLGDKGKLRCLRRLRELVPPNRS